MKNQNNGPQVERAPAASPDLLCTCSPAQAPPRKHPTVCLTTDRDGIQAIQHYLPATATCFRADKSSPASLQPSAASLEAGEVGSGFAIAQRTRCSRWGIGSGLFTATTSQHGHLGHSCLGAGKTSGYYGGKVAGRGSGGSDTLGSELSMPQGQGSLLGHHTLSISSVCQCSLPSPGPPSRCPVSPRS